MAFAPEEWDEVGKVKSAVNAFLILLSFFLAIALSSEWNVFDPPREAPIIVSLSLPDLPLRELDWEPAEPEPEPTPKPEPKPAPAPEPTPTPTSDTQEADIALKKKKEKERKEENERLRREEEERKKKQEEERLRLEKEQKQREEDERLRREQEQQREEEERQLAEEERVHKEKKERQLAEKERVRLEEEEKVRLEKEESARREEEERKLAEERISEDLRLASETAAETTQRQAVLTNLRAGYISRIRSSIQPHLITPPEARNQDGIKVVVEVILDADGFVKGYPEVEESSGIPEYDLAAVRAVIKASPLPMPKDPDLIKEFSQLFLHITPDNL